LETGIINGGNEKSGWRNEGMMERMKVNEDIMEKKYVDGRMRGMLKAEGGMKERGRRKERRK
jgi:hypothetical protein